MALRLNRKGILAEMDRLERRAGRHLAQAEQHLSAGFYTYAVPHAKSALEALKMLNQFKQDCPLRTKKPRD